VATAASDALLEAGEDGDAAVVRLFWSDRADAAVDPSAHTNIVKRKIKLFLIGFQLSVIDISGPSGELTSCQSLYSRISG